MGQYEKVGLVTVELFRHSRLKLRPPQVCDASLRHNVWLAVCHFLGGPFAKLRKSDYHLRHVCPSVRME